MLTLPPALQPLASYPQWILYRLDQDELKPEKTHKRPIDPRTLCVPEKGTGGAHNPDMWVDAQTALARAATLGPQYGVGFVFTAADPFYFIDVDNCLLPSGEWSDVAKWLCQLFSGAAVEVSQSGRGLHIIGTGAASLPVGHGCKTDYNFDLYSAGRFVALTGTGAAGSAALDGTAQLAQVLPYLRAPKALAGEWTDFPVDGFGGPESDDELIRLACKSVSAAARFGGPMVATFEQLWTGDVDALAQCYPPDQGSHSGSAYDASRADMALSQHLAFWTGNDCERMRSLMEQSGLAREKWSQRPEYLERTILLSCGLQTQWAARQSRTAPAATVAPGGGEVPAGTASTVVVLGSEEGPPEQFVDLGRQRELFAGCTYVEQDHGVMVPGGRVLKPEQFKVLFGGYSFQLTPDGQKLSDNAFEAFTLSRMHRFPRAERSCFFPMEPSNAIIERSGERMVNAWFPVKVASVPGDVSRIEQHMRLLLPDANDRAILWAYMAAIVQFPGVKFQWCPLIQGTPGNGKTLFTRCVAEAVGQRYVHMPRASEFAESKFNDWLYGNLFIGVEDIYVAEKKAHVLEALKPMITGEWLEVEGKGIKKAHREICANFMLNCNHKDGVRKDADDRRLAPFYTAQQTKADLQRDGLTSAYFHDLYKWLRAGGYAHVTHYLQTYPIPDELNPANGFTAPETSSTRESIEVGRGQFEQEILERVEQGAVGYAGGWLSSTYVMQLAQQLRVRIPPRKLPALLEALGYVHCPALPNGRCTAVVAPDGCKPRLYVRADHPIASLTDPVAALRRYSEAQAGAAMIGPGMVGAAVTG